MCLSVPKLFFGYATGTNLMFPFRVGASSVLFPGRSTPDELFDQIERHRPTLPHQRADHDQRHAALRAHRDGRPLVLARGAVGRRSAAARALRRVEAAHRRRDPRRHRLGGDVPHLHLQSNRRREDGEPREDRPGLRSRDRRRIGREVPAGEPGRLRVRGGSTALCYWGDKAKSTRDLPGRMVHHGRHLPPRRARATTSTRVATTTSSR